MKTKVRIITILSLIFACLLAMSMPSFASERIFYDTLDLFSEEERNELASYIRDERFSYSTELKIVTDTGDLMDEYDYMELTGTSYNRSSIILVIRKNGSVYNYDVFTFGDAYYEIDDKEIDRILDNPDVYDNIKSGKVYEGTRAFVGLASRAVSGTLRTPFYSYLLPSACIALAIVAIAVAIIISRYKVKLKSPSYPLERYASLNLTHSNDILVDTIVTKVRINTSGGGSGSGGRSGGGRSGGGHRGGR